jgi:photosystem II stability/assembly factor-like uncharacterized protein
VGSELLAFAASSPAHAGGYIFHFDGNQWAPVYSDPVNDVLSIWRAKIGGGFGTGDSSTILRNRADETNWARIPDLTHVPFYVNAVWGSSMQNVFVVGDSGAILRYSP